MPNISIKGNMMPASPIRKLAPYAIAAKERGVKVYHLNIGQPDIRTPQVARDAIKNYDEEVIEYSPSAGFESYRSGLAEYYRNTGINITDEQVMITTGGSEALMISMLSCLNPGDEVIIPEPFYANYLAFSIYAGVNVIPVTSRIEDGFALPPIKEFEQLITHRTKAILICNPGNPTGSVYSAAELEALGELVQRHKLFLFADEVYREFCYDGEKPKSVMELEGLDHNVILVDSVSKRYSMCGVRVGALVTRNEKVMETALKFAQARLSPPTLGQIAGEAALNTPPSYFQEVIGEYSERRNILVDGLNEIEGVICPKPKGAFYAVAKLPVKNADRFCQWMLEEFNYENETVMMAPASGFYATKVLGIAQVRLAYVLNEESLKRALEILKRALAVYPERTVDQPKLVEA